jgi:LCP family protein required for cell wall assembly
VRGKNQIMAKKVNKKNKLITNILFKLIAFISIVIMLIFCMYIYKLGVLPTKYLTLIYVGIGLIYAILLAIVLPRKVKSKIKGVAAVFFVIFGLVSFFGIKYADKTIEFFGEITKELVQTEDYNLKVLETSNLTLETIKDKKIGIYKNDSFDDVVKNLKSTLKKTIEVVEYDDVVKMFDDLQEGKIDAVLINGTIENLLETDEFKAMDLKLKDIGTVAVPVKGDTEEIVKVVDVTNTPFNIYIAGGDAYGSINKVMNTDVNMVVSVDVKNHKMLFTSIPRDYYVVLPSKGANAYDKLTHAGYYGINESIKAVENLLGIEINYYAKVNFSTIENIVDAIGGIDVNSKYSFCQYKSKTMCYKKGWNHLTKDNVLPFARERKNLPGGDVTRVQNQQLVLDAIIKKISSSKTLVANYTDILSAISKSFSTNLDEKSLKKIVNSQLNNMTGWTIERQNLTGYDGMGSCYSMPKYNLYIMKQDANSVLENSEKIKAFINREELKEEKEEETKENNN